MRWILLLSIALLLGCSQEDIDVQALIDKEIENKCENFIAIRVKKCREEMQKEVVGYVDSLVVAELTTKDSIAMPPRPERPSFDTKIILDDSTKIAPVLK